MAELMALLVAPRSPTYASQPAQFKELVTSEVSRFVLRIRNRLIKFLALALSEFQHESNS